MEVNLRQTVLERMTPFSTADRPVYLVGGAVRDLMLDRPAHDLDFVLPGHTRSLAQEIACQLNGALYVLDEERDTTRVVLEVGEKKRVLLDFATLRAESLEGDLRARDFTINAMAVDVAYPNRLIDPTGGVTDLREKRIRACSSETFTHDPVRVLRAIRQALGFHFQIEPSTLSGMRAAASLLDAVSAERLRDELMRMLDGSRVDLAVRLLDQVGALSYVLPELEALKNVNQSPPHTLDVWSHTLLTLQHLEQLYNALVGSYNEGNVTDLTLGSAVLWLGRYRQQFAEHYGQVLVHERTVRALLFLAALYHDISKPETRTEEEGGKVRFLGHQTKGARKLNHRGRALALSVQELQRMDMIVEHHMRVHLLASSREETGSDQISRRAIFRFFKDTGAAGVDICLLSLADLRATYGFNLPQEIWQAELETCRAMLEAYWEKTEQVVAPPRLLSGDDLMTAFGLKPGRTIGGLLGAIRESQAAGEIETREQALSFAERWLSQAASAEGDRPREKRNGNQEMEQ